MSDTLSTHKYPKRIGLVRFNHFDVYTNSSTLTKANELIQVVNQQVDQTCGDLLVLCTCEYFDEVKDVANSAIPSYNFVYQTDKDRNITVVGVQKKDSTWYVDILSARELKKSQELKELLESKEFRLKEVKDKIDIHTELMKREMDLVNELIAECFKISLEDMK